MRVFYLILCLGGCSETTGVIPATGTDETRVDPAALARAEEQKRIPLRAERLTLPKVFLSEHESFPIRMKDLLPTRKRGTSVKLVGEIKYPNLDGFGGNVFVKFRPHSQLANLPREADGKCLISHSLLGSTTAPAGHPPNEWTYEIDGKYPSKPGRYEVLFQVLHLALVPNANELPLAERTPTTTVMEGEVTVE